MSDWAVRFEDVSKTYRRGGPSYRSVRAELTDRILRRPDRDRQHGTRALHDVSFDVAPGEAFGIVGPNGAGKTTALRLLSRISRPTSGRVMVRGRVGALMEVGTGLHPELTGQENVHLYGSILGLPRREIDRRFDEIVAFAETGDAIDTQVKYYSSGMQLRLGFAIAAHLEPDVFVIDEALAVGDASFQSRCVERMSELVRAGTTLLFVSHHLTAVEAVCDRALFLEDGRVRTLGPVRDTLREYLGWVDEHQRSGAPNVTSGRDLRFHGLTCRDADSQERYAFRTGEDIEVALHLEAAVAIERPHVTIGISGAKPYIVTACSMLTDGAIPERIDGQVVIRCTFRSVPLRPQVYDIWVGVQTRHGIGSLLDWQRVANFRIVEEERHRREDAPLQVTAPWPVEIAHDWDVEHGVARG